MIYAVVNNNAVFVMRVLEGDDLDSIIIDNVYLENSIPPTKKNEVA